MNSLRSNYALYTRIYLPQVGFQLQIVSFLNIKRIAGKEYTRNITRDHAPSAGRALVHSYTFLLLCIQPSHWDWEESSSIHRVNSPDSQPANTQPSAAVANTKGPGKSLWLATLPLNWSHGYGAPPHMQPHHRLHVGWGCGLPTWQ